MAGKDIAEEMLNDEEFLEHYGVLGMKWGVRRSRAQRKAASKKRKKGKTESDETPKKKTPKPKPKRSISEMSNKELAARNKRMGLEREFKKLTAEQQSKGKKIIKDILVDVGSSTARTYLKKYAEVQIDASFERQKGKK